MGDLKSAVASAVPGIRLRENVSYKELTTLGVGTTLPLLAEPESAKQLEKLLRFVHRTRTPYFVFGSGSNVIGMDLPYRGLGIRLAGEEFSRLENRDGVFTCGAKLQLSELVSAAAAAGFAGVSGLAGIPGTVGGAARMNAGANGVETGTAVTGIYGFTADGRPLALEGEALKWVYRRGPVPDGAVVTSVVFKLAPSTPEEERRIISEVLAARREREPRGRTAGCAFRNVSSTDPAGKLIDQCGLKGLRCEDMQISDKHANYMVNLSGETMAADYLRLLVFIRRAVSDRSGFFLKLEQIPIDPEFEETLYREVPAIKVNVLCGGVSSEREVSLRSGAAVADALRNGGFDVELTDVTRCRITPSMRRCDVIYPVLHGGFGEDGRIQKLMERAGLRFACSGSAACAAVMDKIVTKRLMDKTKMPTAPWRIVTRDNCDFPEELGLPLILKVPCEGSTVGIVKVDSREDWPKALESEFKLADELLVESFIRGIEISIPVIGGIAYDAIEIRSPSGFYDYDAKYIYKNGHTQYFCPPESLKPEEIERAKKLAEAFYFVTGCRDLVRVDFIVAEDGTPFILEGNALPGCTATSLVPKAARVRGVSFEALTAGMVYSAMRRPVFQVREASGGEVLTGRLACVCTWLFRLALVLCALVLATSGLVALFTGLPGWPLILAAVLMVLAEGIFTFLKAVGKR
ncbi:MAG: D-alanine--D-alanine ligase [Lentisphaeria bacterium]|nr:D-alanine--D-alanine ligase [Lentisphaeria bacterium]